MTRKTLTIAAAVAAVLGATGLGATAYAGRTTEARYNVALDRVLAQLPFLKVEQRSYRRDFLGAKATTVLRLELPPPARAGRGSERGAGEGKGEAAVANPGIEADAEQDNAQGSEPESEPESGQDGKRPRAVLLAFNDRIRHGPFPGSLAPAAARVAMTVDMTVETTDGKASSPVTVLTADTTLDFSDGYRSRFASPAREWTGNGGSDRVTWSGLSGESTGNLATLQSRSSVTSPGLTMQAGDRRGGPSEMVIGALKAESQFEPSPSLLSAPGTVTVALASIRMTTRHADGRPLTVNLTNLDGRTSVDRDGDLLAMRNTVAGQGQVDQWKIDRFEMVEQWKRIHAPSFDAMMRQFYGSLGQPAGENDPAALLASLKATLHDFLPFDPEYALERLSLSVDGRAAELSWRLGLKGVTADDFDQPMRLAGKAAAGFDAKLPRPWLEALMTQAGPLSPTVDLDRISGLLVQGQRMGLLTVEADAVSTTVRLAGGNLEVNGRSVFKLPPSR